MVARIAESWGARGLRAGIRSYAAAGKPGGRGHMPPCRAGYLQIRVLRSRKQAGYLRADGAGHESLRLMYYHAELGRMWQVHTTLGGHYG